MHDMRFFCILFLKNYEYLHIFRNFALFLVETPRGASCNYNDRLPVETPRGRLVTISIDYP